ncbi:hypothetical protein HYV84_00530 [Candidatus Woesearchaeota archaeon]|nr:hypothetical protein [Candidatus Woesearchaeota archaeon]
MNEKEQILQGNCEEYLEFAEQALAKKKFNTAVTLFFKAIGAAADFFILMKEGIVPSSHAQRFKILKEKYPDIYCILDKDFPFYQESYTKKLTEEAAEVLKDDAYIIKKLAQENKK